MTVADVPAIPDYASPPVVQRPPKLPTFGLLGDLVQHKAEQKWIVENLIPDVGGLIVIAGPPKTAAKSLKMLLLTVNVARGLAFLGRKTQRRDVLYVALEDGMQRFVNRAAAMGITPGMPIRMNVATPASREALESVLKFMRETENMVIVLDPFINYATLMGLQDENDSIQIQTTIQGLRAIATERNHTLLLVHHYRKAGDMMRGSGAINGASDGWWDVTPTKTKGVTRIATTLRDGEPVIIGIKMTFDGSQFAFETTDVKSKEEEDAEAEAEKKGGGQAGVKKRVVAEKVRELLENSKDRFYSIATIAEEVGAGRESVRKALTSLEENGFVTPPGTQSKGWQWRALNGRQQPNVDAPAPVHLTSTVASALADGPSRPPAVTQRVNPEAEVEEDDNIAPMGGVE